LIERERFGRPGGQCPPQAHAPPHAHPPDEGADPSEPVANTEKRRRTLSLPHDGHATTTSTVAVIDRATSNASSHDKQRYS
jgi:hypothetical protein